MHSRRRQVELRPNRYDKQLRRLCVYCDTPVPSKRHRWCGPLCVERYQIARGDQNAARRFLWRRELGACQLCGCSTLSDADLAYYQKNFPNREAWRRGPIGGDWRADHIVPIWEGGQLVPENLRTLCRACDRIVTRDGARRRAERKRDSLPKAPPGPLAPAPVRNQDLRDPP